MFKEAFASLKNLQMGFQVLTSLAVIGACILGMWEEALSSDFGGLHHSS